MSVVGENCCFRSRSRQDEGSEKVQKEINRLLIAAKAERDRTIKILLLGTGGVGKSTVIKQMRIIHKNQANMITEAERKAMIPGIHSNIMEAVTVIMNVIDPDTVVFEERSYEEQLQQFKDRDFREHGLLLSNEEMQLISRMWNDPGMQRFTDSRTDISFDESAKYFMERIPELTDLNYSPTDEDVLRVRVRTRGIQEYPVEVDDIIFRLIDVGGQKTERRKWIHCFENVDAVMFIAALSAYDQKTEEDLNVNAMLESLKLFKLIVNEEFQPYFSRSAVILFLNKVDVFENKIMHSDLKKHFPEFSGPAQDIKAAEDFVCNMYLNCNQDPRRDIYTHFTCATDTQCMRFVMTSVQVYITKTALKDVISL